MKIKILFFLHDALLYGASQSLLSILEDLSKDKKYKILVFIPQRGVIEKRLNKANINYLHIIYPRNTITKSGSIFLKTYQIFNQVYLRIKSTSLLKRHIREFRPDILYTNTSTISIGAELALHFKIPHIWHIREFGESDHGLQYFPSRSRLINTLQKSQNAIFPSISLKRSWVQNYVGNFQIIHNGFKCKTISKNTLNHKVGNKNIGLLGAIIPGKGQHIAIDAFIQFSKKYNNYNLNFYGDIGDKKYYYNLLKTINTHKLEKKVKFHGFINDNIRIYKELDILLNCSVSEGFGRTIIEAMAYGIPVIANASGGPLEIIEDGIDGLLYAKTSNNLVTRLNTLVNNDDLYQSISKNGITKYKNKYSEQTYITKVKKYITQVHKSNTTLINYISILTQE